MAAHPTQRANHRAERGKHRARREQGRQLWLRRQWKSDRNSREKGRLGPPTAQTTPTRDRRPAAAVPSSPAVRSPPSAAHKLRPLEQGPKHLVPSPWSAASRKGFPTRAPGAAQPAGPRNPCGIREDTDPYGTSIRENPALRARPRL